MSFTLPFRNVRRNRWRTCLIMIGIAISVGLETGIAITIDSLYEDFINSHRGENFTDITIHPKKNSTIGEMNSLIEVVKSIKGVERASPVATITYMDELSALTTIPNNIIIYGLEPDSHPDYPHIILNDGNHTLERREAIISQSIANFLYVDPGQKVHLSNQSKYDFRGDTVTISGVMDDKSHFGNYIGYFFVLMDLDYLISLFTTESHLNFQIVVKVNDFVSINSIAERIEYAIGLDYYVYREKSISQHDVLAIRSYQAAMNLIIIASFVVEFLFITNILAINVRERSKEFGVLRAVGSSKRQIIKSLGTEILIYSGIGSFIGIIIGLGFSIILIGFLNISYPKVTIEALVLNPNSIISTYITGILVAFISGLYPIFLAISLPVIQNIHWTMRGKKITSKKWIYFLLAGTIITVVGIGTTYFIGPSRFLAFEVISWHFFVVWSIFLGTLLFEVGLLNFLPNLGKRLMFWHKLVPRTIATRNIKREYQKSIITIMVAALALSFILVIGIISASLTETIPDYYNKLYGRIDVIAETTDDAQVSPSFVDELVNNNTSIERAAYMLQQSTKIGNINGYVLGIDPSTYSFFFEETMRLPADPDIPALLNASKKGAIISHILRDRLGVRIGENLTIQISANSSTQVVVTGITSGNPFLQHGYYLYVSNTVFQTFWHNVSANWFIMSTSDDDVPLNTIADQLSQKYPIFKEVIAVDFYARVIKNSLIIQTAFFQILFLNTFLLAGLAQFICILISTLKMEREMGIMRALGLSKREVFSTFFAESTLLGITGAAIGIFNGIIGGELLAWYISQSIPIETNVSLSLIAFWVIVSFLITVVSTIVPSYRSSTKSITNAINYFAHSQLKMNPLVWPDWDKIVDDYLDKRIEIVSPHLTTPKEKEEH